MALSLFFEPHSPWESMSHDAFTNTTFTNNTWPLQLFETPDGKKSPTISPPVRQKRVREDDTEPEALVSSLHSPKRLKATEKPPMEHLSMSPPQTDDKSIPVLTPSVISEESTQKPGTRFSCPYRKRNPGKFNVRDHQVCATQSFATITLVKRHVMEKHKAPSNFFRCTKCGVTFGSRQAANAHEQNNLCMPRTLGNENLFDDVETGISEKTGDRLRDRRKKKQVNTWPVLWEVLFPEDGKAPQPDFEPIIEGREMASCFIQLEAKIQPAGGGTSNLFRRMQQDLENYYQDKAGDFDVAVKKLLLSANALITSHLVEGPADHFPGDWEGSFSPL